MRTREEHIKFRKEQAYKQFNFDISGHELSDPDRAIINACTSMLSDMSKHPETEGASQSCAMLMLMVDHERSMRRFIDGFN